MDRLAIFAIVAATLLPNTLSAKEQILCRRSSAHDIVVTLGASTQFGRTLDCIAGDFIVDITPCAPIGGYGLSAGTGNAALVAIVDRWQDYIEHLGGVTGHGASDHEIYFSGGFNSPPINRTVNQNRASVGLPPIPGGDRLPENRGYRELWKFSISRLTGEATLQQKGRAPLTYFCRKAKAIL